MGATMAGISAFGKTIGAASSYGAFIAALQHIRCAPSQHWSAI